jgi:hypothetical protein
LDARPVILASATGTLKCPLQSGTDYLLRCWSPSQQITIGSTTNNPTFRSLLEDGVTKWQSRLADGLAIGTPQLQWDNSPTPPSGGWTITINLVGNPSGDAICGEESGGVITLTSCVDGPTTGTLDVVLAHELSSAMGWEDETVEQILTPGKLFTTPEALGVSDRCISVFPAGAFPKPLNTQVCNHDVDGIMRLYEPDNFPSVNLGSFADYWGVPILSQSDVSVSQASVAMGDSILINATLLFATEADAGYFISAPTSAGAHLFVPQTPVRLERRGNYLTPTASATAGPAVFALRPFAPSGFRMLRPLELLGKGFVVQVTDPPPNLPPSGLAASASGTTSITLTWDAPASAPTEYVVQRGISSGGPFIEVARPAGSSTSYPNTGLATGTTYWYRIAAVRSGAESAFSAAVSATTDTAPVEALRMVDLIVPDTALHVGSTVIFQGVVAGVQPNEPITFYWDFDESDTPGPDDSHQQIPSTFHRWVRAGDYTLTITVRPWSAWRGFGLPQTRHVVVCPAPGGGGGDLFAMGGGKTIKPGNPTPMAAAGCAQ